MKFQHTPIMFNQCMEFLDVKPDGVYVDCTAGGGGHSEGILTRLCPKGRLIDIDKDTEALDECKRRFAKFSNVTYVHSDYKRFDAIMDELGIDKVDGIMVDLGISSYQIDNRERGFSYMSADAPLDMRMDQTQKFSAYDIVNTYDEQRLIKILRDYGEEKFASQIAKNIVKARESAPIATCGDLDNIIAQSVPLAVQRKGGHPAKRTFQALRIEVNGELDGLEQALYAMVKRLKSGGNIVVLTFHSLEDRIVKRCFNDCITDCICPPSYPVCVCNHRAIGRLLNKKPITPTEEELTQNTRSASCKLRALSKL